MDRDPEDKTPRPLRTSLVLLGIGVVAIGGAAIALPRLAPTPVATHTVVVDHGPATTPGTTIIVPATGVTSPESTGGGSSVAQGQTERHANDDAGAIGGGPRPMDEEEGGAAAGANGDNAASGNPPVVHAPVNANGASAVIAAPIGGPGTVAIAGADGGVGGAGTTTGTTGDAGTIATNGEAGAGGTTGSSAGALSAGDTTGLDGGTGAGGTSADGGYSAGNSQLAFPLPAYGAPPASTSTSGPVTNGAAGSTTPLWGVSGGGGTGTTSADGNGGVVNPRASIAATFLLSMSSSDDPERAWTSITPYLKSGDVVLARIAGDSSTSSVAFTTWSDRVRTDVPLVAYVLGVSDVAKLKAMIGKGLPATLDAIGPSQTDGVDLPTATSLSTSVRAAGKRFFLSVSSSTKTGLAQLGARADIVELVIAASDPTAAANETAIALGALRSAGNPLVFVRLPTASTSSTTAASTMASTLQQKSPNVGFALPPGTSPTMLSELRATP